jgi:sec-independent protein translocase protein TatC
MFFAPLLKLRDQLTRKRHALTNDEEKPFLSHLEDLRKTLTRIVLTLVFSVVACFVFNEWFFDLVRDPLRRAGLEEPKERKLPEAILALPAGDQQRTWWRIHNAARGAAALEGEQRRLFMEVAAPDPLTRQLAEAVLLHHAASMVPEKLRDDYLGRGTALLPAADGAAVLGYARQLIKAGTTPDLNVPMDMVETEAFAPAESFMLSMKLSLFAGIIVSFPLLLYFLLEFILPGLTERERRLLWPALFIGFGLFLSGVLFAFYFVTPRALEFFHEYSASIGIRDRWRIGQYISFVTTFCLIFGLAFELPVVVMVMVKLGLLESTTMRRTRAWAVLIILVASAVLTPTGDMLTMSMLALPMVVMYEACIWLAVLHERKERKLEEAERAADMARRASFVPASPVPARTEDETASDPYDRYHSDYHDSHHGHHDHHGHDAHGSGESGGTPWHPHHQDPDSREPDAEYEQYLREHAHLYDQHHTHPENIPAEDRPGDSHAAANPETETPIADSDKSSEGTGAQPAETAESVAPTAPASPSSGEADPGKERDPSAGPDSPEEPDQRRLHPD